MLKALNFSTTKRLEMLDITDKVNELIKNSGIKDGIAVVYCPHTSAALAINESTDDNVNEDIMNALARLFPHDDKMYTHVGTNADSHIKMAILGSNHTVIIEDKEVKLGRWQALYLCELDGPRDRKVLVKMIAG